jgi:hypothetical protein
MCGVFCWKCLFSTEIQCNVYNDLISRMLIFGAAMFSTGIYNNNNYSHSHFQFVELRRTCTITWSFLLYSTRVVLAPIF